MSYPQQYNRKHQAKNRYKENNNQRNLSGGRSNHLNSSIYGIPTIDKNEKEEENRGLQVCGRTSAMRNTMVTMGRQTSTNTSADPSTTVVSHVQKQVSQVKRGNDSGNNSSIISSSGNGYQKVTVAIPGCKPQSFTVCVGNDPKDVQKWIQERRANYPTRAKVLFKEQQKQATNNATTTSTPSASLSQTFHTSHNFATSLTASSQKNSHQNTSLLGSLLAGYDSSSSTESKDEKEKDNYHDKSSFYQSSLPPPESTADTVTLIGESMKVSNNIMECSVSSVNHSPLKKRCRYFLRGKCFRGKECTFLHDDTVFTEASPESEVRPIRDDNRNAKRYIEDQQQQQQQPGNDNKHGTSYQKKKKAKRLTNSPTCTNNTLLRKLLDSDIKREASIILQLLRYIVQSNFFDDQKSV